MGYIYLQPAGEISEETVHYLGTGLKEIFRHPYKIAMPIRIPEYPYSEDRGQYNAAGIVEKIAENISDDAEKILGIIDVDLFVPGTNFVFGVAIGNAAVISLTRLHPGYYGEISPYYE